MRWFKSSNPLAVLALILANVLPIYLAATSGIKPAELLFLYWAETWVIAFYTILKIKKAAAPLTDQEKNLMRVQLFASQGEATRESIIRVFILQFLVIISVYGALILGFLVPQVLARGGDYITRVLTAFPSADTWPWFLTAVLGFIASHGISYTTNFLAKKEFLNTTPARQSLTLGDRLIAMHLFLMFGSVIGGEFFDLSATAQNLYNAVIGIAFIKLIADLAAHSKEHMIARAIGLVDNKPAGVLEEVIKFFTKNRGK